LSLLLFLLACSDDKPSVDSDDLSTSETADQDSAITESSGPSDDGDTDEDSGATTGTDDTGVADTPLNVLMISLDTTRIDGLGRFSDGTHTPNLDALMDRSLVLDDHFSCSNWTFASVLCVQAGARGTETGFIPEVGNITDRVPETVQTAEKVLSDVGYQTALLSSNPYFHDSTGVARDFDFIKLEQDVVAEDLTDWTLDALSDMDADKPWYVHAHYIDPHAPYTPPASYTEDAIAALEPLPVEAQVIVRSWEHYDTRIQDLTLEHLAVYYNGELEYFDDQLGRLLAEAEAMGMLENTLVVFWTDHGEQFSDHGGFGHGNSLYWEENRSVASFQGPGVTPESWTGPTSHEDIWPTTLTLMGITVPDSFTGHPAWEHPEDDIRYGLDYQLQESQQFVERGGYKLIHRWEDNTFQLYNLMLDPEETVDIFDFGDATSQQLYDELIAERARVRELRPTKPGPGG